MNNFSKLSVALAAAASVSACTPTLTAQEIAQIQQGAVAACSFLPTGVQIAELIPSASVQSGAALVGPIIKAICTGVSRQSGRFRGAGERSVIVKVGDEQVTVTGHFVAVRRR